MTSKNSRIKNWNTNGSKISCIKYYFTLSLCFFLFFKVTVLKTTQKSEQYDFCDFKKVQEYVIY